MEPDFLVRIYQEQAKMIYFYLKKNGCRHEDAEDIVQESYTKFFAYQNGVASEKALSYIFTIALNEFRKLMKNRGKETVLSVDDDYFWNNLMSDYVTETTVLTRERGQDISETLMKMKEVYRQLLVMKYEYDLSYKEISLLIGMKVETVRMYLFRARNEFQGLWRERHG